MLKILEPTIAKAESDYTTKQQEEESGICESGIHKRNPDVNFSGRAGPKGAGDTFRFTTKSNGATYPIDATLPS